MDLVVFEENKPLVLKALENGEFDYMDAASEVFETEFFKYIGAKEILGEATRTYPTPRLKEDVPLWVYIASELSMRLHGVHSFNAYPMVVRIGGMLNALAPKISRCAQHPQTKDMTIACEGFNGKNHYDRETPCDPDFLRKLARDSDAQAQLRWFSVDLPRIFRGQRAFDPEGIFIGDASYLFVPDNPNYENSSLLLFDENDHPLSKEEFEKLSDERKVRCQYRRCYKMVTLLHTNATRDFFLFVGMKIVPGKDHECPLLYQLVKQFIEAVGMGVIKKLIVDRGFLDGKEISECKIEYAIDVLIPVRKNMDVYVDAMGLFAGNDVQWVAYQQVAAQPAQQDAPPRFKPLVVRKRESKRQQTLLERKRDLPPPPPESTIVREEVAAIGDFTSWSSCTVPLTVIASREHFADGHQDCWLLLSTRQSHDPLMARREYGMRPAVEERYRQLKCFTDLSGFTSRVFSLVVNHVVFTIFAYNLLQFYLLRKHRKELNKKTPLTIRRQLLPVASHVIICYQNYYGLFTPMELTELLTLGLSEEARKKIGEKCRRLRRELTQVLQNPRPP
jgi:hypothetical protein